MFDDRAVLTARLDAAPMEAMMGMFMLAALETMSHPHLPDRSKAAGGADEADC